MIDFYCLKFLQKLIDDFVDLAQNQFLEDEGMINYLQYLQYWKQPEYAKFILYPHCIFFLDMLQHKSFREECKNTEFCNFLTKQQGLHWNFYKQNRENTSSSTEPTNDAEQIPENDEKQ